MKRFCFLFALIIAVSLHAIQWPMEEPELIHGFGNTGEGVVESSIRLKGKDGQVRSYNEGELIFLAREGYGLPGTEGMVILQHEGGFRSCYSGLDVEKNLENRSYLKEGDPLGTTDRGLEFSIRDSALNQWVNPFFMFSVEDDLLEPVVEDVILTRDGQTYSLGDSSTLAAGNYRLKVRISDRMDEAGAVLFPYSVKIRYLGQVQFSLALDSLVSRQGRMYFEGNGSRPADSIFTEEGYLDAGEIIINQGRGLLEVELTDYRGNRTTRAFPLNRS